jgi:hypothetical protein
MVFPSQCLRHYEKYSFIVELIFPEQAGDVNWSKGESLARRGSMQPRTAQQ